MGAKKSMVMSRTNTTLASRARDVTSGVAGNAGMETKVRRKNCGPISMRIVNSVWHRTTWRTSGTRFKLQIHHKKKEICLVRL